MITLIHGEDAFSAAEEVARLSEELIEPAWRQVSLSVFDAAASVADIVSAARSASFCGNRLVIVRGCPWFNPISSDRGRKGASSDEDIPDLEVATDGPSVVALFESGLPDGCHLILVVPRKIHAGMTTSKAALAAQKAGRAKIVEFAAANPFRKDSTYDWVVRRAKAIGGAIVPEAAQFLVDRLGQERYLLDQELHKLISFAAGRPVERKDVALLSPPGEADVFELVESVILRRPAEAIASLRKLVRFDHPLKILATMSSLVRAYVQEKALVERRRSVDDIAAAVKRQPGRVRWDLDLLRRWTSEQLVGAFAMLSQAEADLKRGSGTDLLVMERLIVQLSSL